MQEYPFTWLDEVIEVTLNPMAANVKLIKPAQLEQIRQQFPAEARKIFCSLRSHSFWLLGSQQTKAAVETYDSSIRLLAAQAKINMEIGPESEPFLKTGQVILLELGELLNTIYKRYGRHLSKQEKPEPDATTDLRAMLFKVLVDLSVDQVGVIVKAAFEVKIILSRSYRKVCRAIAPYVSTTHKKDISDDGLRSNAGRAEDRDNELAIAALEKIIRHIKGER